MALATQAAALVAAASGDRREPQAGGGCTEPAGTCEHCGEPLDDAGTVLCATCIAAAGTDGGPDPEGIGTAGHVAGYDVFLAGDTIHVTHAATSRHWSHTVPNFGTALAELARQPGLRLGWGRFPDDVEAIYCYDPVDGNFGYAFNLSNPAFSEWGYAPFAEPVPVCDHCGGPLDDEAETDDALQTLCGACIETDRAEAFAAREGAIRAAHAERLVELGELAA